MWVLVKENTIQLISETNDHARWFLLILTLKSRSTPKLSFFFGYFVLGVLDIVQHSAYTVSRWGEESEHSIETTMFVRLPMNVEDRKRHASKAHKGDVFVEMTNETWRVFFFFFFFLIVSVIVKKKTKKILCLLCVRKRRAVCYAGLLFYSPSALFEVDLQPDESGHEKDEVTVGTGSMKVRWKYILHAFLRAAHLDCQHLSVCVCVCVCRKACRQINVQRTAEDCFSVVGLYTRGASTQILL